MMNTPEHNAFEEKSSEEKISPEAADMEPLKLFGDEDKTFQQGLYLEPIPNEDESP